MPDLKHARRPIRDLVAILGFRATYGHPCYIKRNTVHAALIVPTLSDGPDGSYGYLKTFQRATIHEAVVLGFVTLGADLVDVPDFGAISHWSTEPALQGRTITLRGER